MSTNLRHKLVAVGVIHDAQRGFLLFYNEKWDQFAFCMKKPKVSEDLGEVALVALEEDNPLRFPEAKARPLEAIGAFGESGSVGEGTYYNYHVFELDPGPVRRGSASDPTAKFFQYQDLLKANNVTWSTKDIARAMMEYQEVSLAVVTRRVAGKLQFLLVHKPSYGYFFPTARRKKNEPAEALAVKAVEWDASFGGDLQATWRQEVCDIHDSQRFGSTHREFVFQVCTVKVVDVDLAQAGNPFADSLDAFQRAKQAAGQPLGTRGYWNWFTEEEMRDGNEMSPTMKAILPNVLACVGNA